MNSISPYAYGFNDFLNTTDAGGTYPRYGPGGPSRAKVIEDYTGCFPDWYQENRGGSGVAGRTFGSTVAMINYLNSRGGGRLSSDGEGGFTYSTNASSPSPPGPTYYVDARGNRIGVSKRYANGQTIKLNDKSNDGLTNLKGSALFLIEYAGDRVGTEFADLFVNDAVASLYANGESPGGLNSGRSVPAEADYHTGLLGDLLTTASGLAASMPEYLSYTGNRAYKMIPIVSKGARALGGAFGGLALVASSVKLYNTLNSSSTQTDKFWAIADVGVNVLGLAAVGVAAVVSAPVVVTGAAIVAGFVTVYGIVRLGMDMNLGHYYSRKYL